MADLSSVLGSFKNDLQRKEAAKAAAEKKKAAKEAAANGGFAPTRRSTRPGRGQREGSPSGPLYGQSTRDFLATGRARSGVLAPLGKLQKDVVDHLESVRRPLTPAQIKEAMQADLHSNTELRERLQRASKVAYDAARDTYAYKPEENIADSGELLAFLLKQPRGCPVERVADAYHGAEDDLKALQAEDRLWRIPNSELGDVVFPKDTKLQLAVSADMQAFWHEIKVPEDPAEVTHELQKARLKPVPRRVARKRVAPPPKEKKRRNVKIRLDTATNVHMPELLQGADTLQSID